QLVLRIEDLDEDRVVPGATEAILDDLQWLGVEWDEGPDVGGPVGPYVQTARKLLYEAALAELARQGLVYACDCSRAEIARAARAPSAPHAGDEGPRYPGTCRELATLGRTFRRPPAMRLRVPRDARIAFDDRIFGPIEEDVFETTGDFVIRRGDGVFAYQLAV